MRKFILIFLMFIVTHSFAQNSSNSDSEDAQLKEVLKQGAWLISKTEPDFEKIGSMLSNLMQEKIIPQAIDRNFAGELLIISQLSPPALPGTRWHLGVYESESEMMHEMQELAKEGWTPTGMDIQTDAAFVLYLFTDEQLTGARLIKIKSIDELSNSIEVYYELGYLPVAISTFRDALWILFSSILQKDISQSDVMVRIAAKDDTSNLLIKELSNSFVSLIDVTYTADDKVIMLFHNSKVEAESPTEKN